VSLHEFGHVLAGKLVGYRLFRLVVWPFIFVTSPGGLKIRYARGVALFSGSTLSLPPNVPDVVRRQVILTLGGPVVSFLVAIAVFVVATRVHQAWMWGIAIAAAILVFSILPTSGRTPSDGKRIVDLLFAGPRRERAVAMLRIAALVRAGSRPRELPAELIQSACALSDGSFEEAVAHYNGFVWALDSGAIESAKEHLDRALAIYDPRQRHQIATAIEKAFMVARFEGDGPAARALLDASRGAYAHPHVRMRALAATLLAEGKADAALSAASAALSSLDACGEDLSQTLERDLIASLLYDAGALKAASPVAPG